MPPWNSAKTKVQLRIAVQRLRLLQEKKEAQAKTARRDIATLLEQAKLEKARVKVEAIINEDIHIELLELLELYCELLLARFGLLEQNTREPDQGISEGVCSIIYAAPRTELKELHVLRDMLMHKYGRDFSIAVMDNKDGCVSERVMKKLAFHTPPEDLVDAYLREIAKGYGINWAPEPKPDDEDFTGGGGVKDASNVPASEALVLPSAKIAADEKVPALPTIPPTEDSDKSKTSSKSATPIVAPQRPKTPEDEFALLAKRFEALKKR
ncbi:DUF292-domain-containing protein [Fomitiporia mediterranea MF3/22]|uniref:DUF292-domain-containing protein n=1 Tax=Fomitiporia mediterranea (strain MF3/22) TaxID=694068 RepID=UPI0004407DB9|nr:DUF292-domain-containing protein [Fomitiporia mediterranea MF3/22]EJC98801.1 DUF292-domain-containing protein [Fomitiporia mediterranea MF3/22]